MFSAVIYVSLSESVSEVLSSTQFPLYPSNLLVNVNHVYVGMPNLQLTNEEVGTTIDFRRSQDANNWTSVHETVGGIEQPDLTKIKSVFLFFMLIILYYFRTILP